MSIYRALGVEPIINATGTVTRLGGAPMPPQVIEAFCEGAAEWVPLEQLQAAASRKIAEATGTQAGLVTGGAAAAFFCRRPKKLVAEFPQEGAAGSSRLRGHCAGLH